MNEIPESRGPAGRVRTCSNLLHVEDNPEDVDLFQMALSRSAVALDVSVVCDGEEAMSYLQGAGPYARAVHPDLILLDLNLPKKDGKETLAELKRDQHLKVIPVIVFTTSNSPIDVKECYDLGAACYIVKPVDFDGLVDVIRKTFAFWLETIPPQSGSRRPPVT